MNYSLCSKNYFAVSIVWGSAIALGNLYSMSSIVKKNPSINVPIPLFASIALVKGIGYGVTWPMTMSHLAWAAYHNKGTPILNAVVPFGSTTYLERPGDGWKWFVKRRAIGATDTKG